MKFLHSMIRVSDPAATVAFFQLLGLEERRRTDNEKARFSLIFLGVPGDEGGEVELTHNWDESGYGGGRNFGHLAYQVDDIYETCQRLVDKGVTIRRPPRDGHMAFVRSPDNISIELLQKGERLAPAEPWASMPNTGEWQAGLTAASPTGSGASIRSSRRRWRAPAASISASPRWRPVRLAPCPAGCRRVSKF